MSYIWYPCLAPPRRRKKEQYGGNEMWSLWSRGWRPPVHQRAEWTIYFLAALRSLGQICGLQHPSPKSQSSMQFHLLRDRQLNTTELQSDREIRKKKHTHTYNHIRTAQGSFFFFFLNKQYHCEQRMLCDVSIKGPHIAFLLTETKKKQKTTPWKNNSVSLWSRL